jgi:hypothetical protein
VSSTIRQTEAVYSPNPGDTLVFENDRVRVWSMTLPPHGMYDFHQHHFDHIILWPDAGRVESQNLGDDDWPLIQSAEPGFVGFKTVGSAGPMVPHRIRNLENRAVTHYVIELISEPSPSDRELPVEANGRGRVTDARGHSASEDQQPSEDQKPERHDA